MDYCPANGAAHEDRGHDRAGLARPRRPRADGRGGHGRRPAELLARHRRAARRDRAARPRGGGPRRPAGGDPAGPPGPEAAHRRRCARTPPSCSVGDVVTFECGNGSPAGDARRMSIAWDGLATAIDPGEVLYLADGAIRLRAVAVRGGDGEIDAEVEVGGTVASRQGLNIPGPLDILPAVPEEDLHHLRAGQQIGVDLVALSFVRRPEDVLYVREHTRTPLIAKIEKPQGVDRAEDILKAVRLRDGRPRRPRRRAADRGGADDPEAPARAGRHDGAPVDHGHPDARLDGHLVAPDARRGRRRRQRDPRRHRRGDALPGDRGRRPPGARRRDHGRGRAHDRAPRPYREWNDPRVRRDERDPAYTVAHSACAAARELHLDALVVPTLIGRSARLVSAHRPEVPIYALSPGRETVRRCGLMWGVRAASMKRHETTEALIADACAARGRARLVPARPARRRHRRAAERQAGHDEPVPGPGPLTTRGRAH